MPPSNPDLQLVVGGNWLRSQGAWGDLAYSSSWPGGCKEASWGMTSTYAARLPTLTRGARVSVLWGPEVLWTGYLSEPDWNGSSVTVTALGLSRLGERYAALDSTGAATTNPVAAVTAAITRGLPWTLDGSVPNLASNIDVTSAPLTVSGLMDATGLLYGARWAVDQHGLATMVGDPTDISYVIPPGSADLGISDDNYASTIVLTYRDTSGTNATVIYPPTGYVTAYEARYGHDELVVDATSKQPMTADVATNLARSVYDLFTQRPGWTNGVALSYGELTTPGGQPLHPARAQAGRVVQAHGIRDEVTFDAYTTFVAGDVSYTDSTGEVQIDPVDLNPRSLEDALALASSNLGITDSNAA